jgi:predicted outer membrane repeat protein
MRRLISICSIYSFLCLYSIAATASMGATEADVFVDLQATGNGNGSSWKNAYTDLQTALENAIDQDGDGDIEIWIAQGVYIPTKVYTVGGEVGGLYGQTYRAANGGSDPADLDSLKTFNLTEVAGALEGTTVKLVGAGTILSGDLLGDDVAGDLTQNRWDNVYHVIIAVDDVAKKGVTAILEGLTIASGQSAGDNNGQFISVPSLPEDYMHNSGSAIYMPFFGADVTLDHVVVRNNSGALAPLGSNPELNHGSTIETKDYIGSSSTRLTIQHSTFSNNRANRGGALAASGDNTVVNINESAFLDNKAVMDGGAIEHNWNAILNIYASSFTGNQVMPRPALFADGPTGGAIHSFFGRERGELYVSKCTFTANRAQSGGAIEFGQPDGFLTIVNSKFINNEAFFDPLVSTGNGGALLIDYNQEVLIENNMFEGNTATGAGGAILTLGDMKILNNKFKRNSSMGAGGALYVVGGFYFAGELAAPSVNVENNHFHDNIGENGGGAILLVNVGLPATAVNVTMHNNQFHKNQTTLAGSPGGAIYIAGPVTSTITDSEFKQNLATGVGGAILAAPTFPGNGPVLIVNNTSFEKNTTTEDGGAIFAVETELTVENNDFKKNEAAGSGGALFLLSVTGLLQANNYKDNAAVVAGDDFFIINSPLLVNLDE